MVGALAGIFCLSVLSMFFLFSNIKLKNEITTLKESSQKLEQNFKFLQEKYDSLSSENQKISSKNKALEQESVSLSSKMKAVLTEVDKVVDKLADFESSVTKSINWFKENSNVENLEIYDSMKTGLNSCIEFRNSCRINFECINSVNEKNKFKYRLDEETTGRLDFLKDLRLIYNQKGGDCEDYSILFKAEYNYLLGKCLQNYSRNEVVPFTTEKEINRTYMYVVCGNYDFGGHCQVALTKMQIERTSDLYPSIKASTLVEPQNGHYYADMGDTELMSIYSDGVAPDKAYYLYFVITDDDLLIYYPYADEIKWIGYHDFLKMAESIKGRVKK